jgi:hypothetical protein
MVRFYERRPAKQESINLFLQSIQMEMSRFKVELSNNPLPSASDSPPFKPASGPKPRRLSRINPDGKLPLRVLVELVSVASFQKNQIKSGQEEGPKRSDPMYAQKRGLRLETSGISPAPADKNLAGGDEPLFSKGQTDFRKRSELSQAQPLPTALEKSPPSSARAVQDSWTK